MVRLAWATKAVEDLFQIHQYFSSVSEKYAQAFLDQLFKKVEILKSYPNLGRVVPELKSGRHKRAIIQAVSDCLQDNFC